MDGDKVMEKIREIDGYHNGEPMFDSWEEWETL